LGAGVAIGTTVAGANAAPSTASSASAASSWYYAPQTATPIKHVVVIFQENVSFDHYFGTYPFAANIPGDGNPFQAAPSTPKVNGLYRSINSSGPSGPLLSNNPNTGTNGQPANPTRLTYAQALTCDQDHGYTAEQQAFNSGKMDKFVQFTNVPTCTTPGAYQAPNLVMDYYDGNTVTGLWNYAQNYAMSENNYNTNFGPSTPGALNVISGYDGSSYAVTPSGTKITTPIAGTVSALNSDGLGTIYGDLDPSYDGCSASSSRGVATGQNIGDLLNAKNITWGWFQGGFAPSSRTSTGAPICASTHKNIAGNTVTDYSPHHEPFQYYASTANPLHLAPSSEAAIGQTDQANHQYDLSDFYETLQDGNMPAVSYLKAAEYQDGHAGYSDPLDEQNFLVNTINQIEESKFWASTAVVITYDDSDGWYDHQASTIVNGSNTTADAAICTPVPTVLGTYPDRCGYGPRLPLLVISPWTRANYVSKNLTDQSSVVKFIEDNWLSGQRIGNGSFDASAGSLDARHGVLDFKKPHFQPVILDPITGEVVKS
jgi:phospholipase C